MKEHLISYLLLIITLLITGCNESDPLPDIMVNSNADIQNPPDGTVTLRSALAEAASGQPIVFDANLDGDTIGLFQNTK